jgi:hypothetical protein
LHPKLNSGRYPSFLFLPQDSTSFFFFKVVESFLASFNFQL